MAVERFSSSGQYYENTGRRIFPQIVIGWLTRIRIWPSTDFSCVPFAVKSKYCTRLTYFHEKNGFFRIFFSVNSSVSVYPKARLFDRSIFSSFISFCVAKSRCQTVSQNVPRKRSPFSKMHHHIASSRITLHPHWSDQQKEMWKFKIVPIWP